MELRQLRYAVAIADAGHFGHAAESLHISQSGLSQQVRALERSLGTQLFVRDAHPVTTTPAGEIFIQHARLVLELADRAEASASLARTGKTGMLKIATNAGGLPAGVAELLEEFQGLHPRVEVGLHPGFSLQNLEALRLRRVDVALVVQPFELPDLCSYLRFGSIEILVAVPVAHPLAELDRVPRDELRRSSVVTLPRSMNPIVVDHIYDTVFANGPRPTLIEVVDVAPIARFAHVASDPAIVGIAFGSETALAPPGVVFRRMEEPEPSIEYGLAWSDAHASPFVEPFLALARTRVLEANR
jgi:DNA-binding transcriptional LysR family regulator